MSDDQLVLLARCYNATEAHILRGILESYDINCFLLDEYHTSAAWLLNVAIGGVRVMVFESDYYKAKDLIADQIEPQILADTNKPIPSKGSYISLLIALASFAVFSVPILFRSKRNELSD